MTKETISMSLKELDRLQIIRDSSQPPDHPGAGCGPYRHINPAGETSRSALPD